MTLWLSLSLLACGSTTPGDSATSGDSGTSTDDTGGSTDCAESWYPDADADGYGDADADPQASCEDPGDGWVANARDCDDTDDATWPGAADTSCDDVDQDCDDRVDEDAADAVTLFGDDDGDGYGDPDAKVESCDADLPGHAANDEDCDDGEPSVNPGEPETCDDGVDNNCDGQAVECRLSGTTQSDRGDVFIEGQDVYQFLGASLSGVGDLNGDGFDDVALGGDGDGYNWVSSQRFGLYVGYGPMDSATTLDDFVVLGQASGENSLGAGLADVGDLDGDGFDDLVVGSPASLWGNREGVVFFHSGAVAAGEDVAGCCGSLRGKDDWGATGLALDGGSDLLGDGQPSVLVGSPLEGTSGRYYDGAAYLVSGLPTQKVGVSETVRVSGERDFGGWFGQKVADLGDTDGDGHGDFLVSAFQNYEDNRGRGRVYLFLGPVSGDRDAADADVIFDGAYDYGYLGSAVASAGDLDGDGHRDMLLGSYGCQSAVSCTHTGAVLVVHGPADPVQPLATRASTISGADAYDQLGSSVDGDFDADGDGASDFVLGAFQASDEVNATDYSGAAYLFHGPVVGGRSADDAELRVHGGADYAYTGHDVTSVGDQDGDGLDDIGIGSVAWSASGEWGYEGAVSIFNGGGL